jgi:sec-independent protein translocase protein TatC
MADSEDQPGAGTPPSNPEADPRPETGPAETHIYDETPYSSGDWSSSGTTEVRSTHEVITAEPATPVTLPVVVPPTVPPPAAPPSATPPTRPPKPPDPPDDDDEDEGMAKMSFLDHLEELRRRLLYAIGGIGVAFVLSLIFSNQLYLLVSEPATYALTKIGINPPSLVQISPMDVFQIVWMKLPILAAIFISSPWILYQVWAFIAPGLYKKERRLAVPFVLSSAGLFILGGLFAYFIAFRYGLEFLLGIGLELNIRPYISVTEYFDLFVDVMLGVGIVFEIPVLLFLLTLIRVASPAFLVRHSRYAILAIVFLAAIITPTGDVFNLALFATPMIILFYIGILASYVLVLRREKRKFPWGRILRWLVTIILVLALIGLITGKYYGYNFVAHWPYFVR